MQLVLSQKEYDAFRPLLGKVVTVSGSLFAAHTGHHHAPLLMERVSLAPNGEHYAPLYSRSVALCNEYSFPNSMARPDGFDLDKHLAEVQAQRRELAVSFATPEGISFIEGRIAQGGDEADLNCAKQLLNSAKVP